MLTYNKETSWEESLGSYAPVVTDLVYQVGLFLVASSLVGLLFGVDPDYLDRLYDAGFGMLGISAILMWKSHKRRV